MKRVFRRPSPAMIVAIVALIAALGGSAVAGGVLNKKKAKNIANNVVTQRAPGLSVASAKSADSATSATSATNATNANNATNATNAANVDGMSGATFKRTYITTTAFENVLTIDGLTVRARCIDAGGVNPDQLDLDAVSGVENSEISADLVGTGDSAQHNIDLDFDAGDAFDMRPGDLASSSGSIVFSTDTSVVTVNYYASEVFLGLGCQTAGVGFGTS
jgi:hypothetical protein